jgi:hypothetical protein
LGVSIGLCQSALINAIKSDALANATLSCFEHLHKSLAALSIVQTCIRASAGNQTQSKTTSVQVTNQTYMTLYGIPAIRK